MEYVLSESDYKNLILQLERAAVIEDVDFSAGTITVSTQTLQEVASQVAQALGAAKKATERPIAP